MEMIILRSGIIDQLLSLRLVNYMKNEMEFVPWSSTMNNILYLRQMLGKSGVFGSFQVIFSEKIKKTKKIIKEIKFES